MNCLKEIPCAGFADAVERLTQRDNSNPDDYVKDGILMCGKCHTPKQTRKLFPVYPPRFEGNGKPVQSLRLLPIACRCQMAAAGQEKERGRELQFRLWMDTYGGCYGISGEWFKDATFESDDGRDPEALEICRRYVARWPQMRDENIGILFYGPNGTGKSFHAEAIVSALLKQRVRALVTSFPKLSGVMEKLGEKQEIIDHLNLFPLVVIDDLGAERDSTYGLEQVFNVIDARYRQKKPLIVTTNIPAAQIINPTGEWREKYGSLEYRRIFSRILEMCPLQVPLKGSDRRAELIGTKQRLAESILKGN